MADFYVNYGSRGAKLLSCYSSGKIKIKLHQISTNRFILSRNRKIVMEYYDVVKALAAFHYLIYMEAPDLFNN